MRHHAAPPGLDASRCCPVSWNANVSLPSTAPARLRCRRAPLMTATIPPAGPVTSTGPAAQRPLRSVRTGCSWSYHDRSAGCVRVREALAEGGWTVRRGADGLRQWRQSGHGPPSAGEPHTGHRPASGRRRRAASLPSSSDGGRRRRRVPARRRHSVPSPLVSTAPSSLVVRGRRRRRCLALSATGEPSLPSEGAGARREPSRVRGALPPPPEGPRPERCVAAPSEEGPGPRRDLRGGPSSGSALALPAEPVLGLFCIAELS